MGLRIPTWSRIRCAGWGPVVPCSSRLRSSTACARRRNTPCASRARRSASVTAAEDTRLFKLGQDDFYSLIADRPQIVHAINRGLCQMVRGMLANLQHTRPIPGQDPADAIRPV